MSAALSPDPVHGVSDPDSWWTTTNVGEAVPGVVTPLGWTTWGLLVDRAARVVFHAMGALPRARLADPTCPEEFVTTAFYGHAAMRPDFFCHIGDVMPGTSGIAVAESFFGKVPEGLVSRPSRRRYPFVFARLPATVATAPRASRRVRTETSSWWRERVERTADLDLAGARTQFADGLEHLGEALNVQAKTSIAAIQPVHEALTALARSVDVDPAALMSGHGGHAESEVIEDLWSVSRDLLSLEEFLLRHGYHGPGEGEISATVWREDPAPLTSLIAGYRRMSEDASPARAERTRVTARLAAEAELLRRLPASRRPVARLLFRLARAYLPLRGHGKSAFLQCVDVLRCTARRIGACLAADGVLADPEDIFFLTAPEVLDPPPDVRELVAQRRERDRYYRTVTLPKVWRGMPEPLRLVDDEPPAGGDTLTGLGVSSGVAEARVVVVDDPADCELDDGEILVAHTTDPSWASVMFLSGGLVVDVGGQLSHAAVVARELGIPCVMGTGNGTRVLKTGDVCRIDGSTGTVQILKRAGS